MEFVNNEDDQNEHFNGQQSRDGSDVDGYTSSPNDDFVNQNTSPPNYMRRSTEDSPLGDARMNRITEAEAAIRKEMFKECTFNPQIRALPDSYGARKELDAPFHSRVTKWQRERDDHLIKKTQAFKASEMSDCTFQPKISKNSEKCMKEIRSDYGNNDPVNERLYKASALYAEQHKKRIEAELLRQEEKEKSFSYHPKLETNKTLFRDINPKYSLPANVNNNQNEELVNDRALKECTFTPKVLIYLFYVYFFNKNK
jgi:hypothetical protein